MGIAVKLTCAGMIALLAGCSSLNPFARKTEPRNVPAALEEIRPTLNVRTGWSASIGTAGNYSFSPALAGDSVYVAAADGSVARLEAGSGRALWRINAGMPLTAGVGSDGATVVVAGDKGQVLAFDASGRQRWSVQASSEVLSAPAVGQGVVVVRSIDNRIAAYDAQTGARRWIAQRTAPPLTLRSAPGIVIAGQNAYVAMPGGRLLALELSNGAPRWEAVVGEPRGATELERIADMAGAPLVVGGDICAVAYQGRVACLDLATGSPRWAREISSEAGIGADERFIYVADERGAVSAFSRDAGVSAWRNSRLANRRLSNPASVGRVIAVGDYQGYVHFLGRDDGRIVARVATDGSRVLSLLPLNAGRVLLQTQSGTVSVLASE